MPTDHPAPQQAQVELDDIPLTGQRPVPVAQPTQFDFLEKSDPTSTIRKPGRYFPQRNSQDLWTKSAVLVTLLTEPLAGCRPNPSCPSLACKEGKDIG